MRDLVNKSVKGQIVLLVVRTVALGLCLSVFTAPLGSLSQIEQGRSLFGAAAKLLVPAANAEVVYPEIDYLKERAQGFRGSAVFQNTLGDIYSENTRNIPKIRNPHTRRTESPYQSELFAESQRNRIEAFYWYSLAAAQLDHQQFLSDTNTALDPLTDEERSAAKKARSRMEVLRGGSSSRRIRGPSLWTAQSKFVDTYKDAGFNCGAAHYIMGKMYRTGKFVEKSNYDAYVWMLASNIENFQNSEILAGEYKGRILVNQGFLANTTANRIVAACSNGSASGGNGSFNNGRGGPTSPGWGSDFQSARQSRDSGNIRVDVPPDVDSHHSSRSAYDMGNGYLAAGKISEAKAMYEIAIAKEPYSRAAIDASRQMQALTLTCSLRDDRVVRMSNPTNRDRVHDIGWDRLQLALKALGYYTPYVDGKPGQETRRAIRAFQRGELNVDETGYLTTDQRVELICAAAQDVRDADSQIQLGIMYARGIGLNCNTAAAHAWFQKAADQGHPTALYNLGLMYLEGFYDRQVPGKHPYTDEEQNIAPRRVIDADVARFFFSEARDKGHPKAAAMLSKIDHKGAKALASEPGVIGCIDYEVESDMLDLQKSIVDFAARVDVAPSDNCPALTKLKTRHAALAKSSGDLWSTVKDYDKNMGQSDRMVDRLSVAEVEIILSTAEQQIDQKLGSCAEPQ
jgi:TPR repeat protein